MILVDIDAGLVYFLSKYLLNAEFMSYLHSDKKKKIKFDPEKEHSTWGTDLLLQNQQIQ